MASEEKKVSEEELAADSVIRVGIKYDWDPTEEAYRSAKGWILPPDEITQSINVDETITYVWSDKENQYIDSDTMEPSSAPLVLILNAEQYVWKELEKGRGYYLSEKGLRSERELRIIFKNVEYFYDYGEENWFDQNGWEAPNHSIWKLYKGEYYDLRDGIYINKRKKVLKLGVGEQGVKMNEHTAKMEEQRRPRPIQDENIPFLQDPGATKRFFFSKRRNWWFTEAKEAWPKNKKLTSWYTKDGREYRYVTSVNWWLNDEGERLRFLMPTPRFSSLSEVKDNEGDEREEEEEAKTESAKVPSTIRNGILYTLAKDGYFRSKKGWILPLDEISFQTNLFRWDPHTHQYLHNEHKSTCPLIIIWEKQQYIWSDRLHHYIDDKEHELHFPVCIQRGKRTYVWDDGQANWFDEAGKQPNFAIWKENSRGERFYYHSTGYKTFLEKLWSSTDVAKKSFIFDRVEPQANQKPLPRSGEHIPSLRPGPYEWKDARKWWYNKDNTPFPPTQQIPSMYMGTRIYHYHKKQRWWLNDAEERWKCQLMKRLTSLTAPPITGYQFDPEQQWWYQKEAPFHPLVRLPSLMQEQTEFPFHSQKCWWYDATGRAAAGVEVTLPF